MCACMRRAESLRRIILPLEPAFLPRSVAAFSGGVPVSAYMETAARAQGVAVQQYLSRLPESVNVLDVAAGDGTFSRNLFEQFAFAGFRATWIDQARSHPVKKDAARAIEPAPAKLPFEDGQKKRRHRSRDDRDRARIKKLLH